MTEKTHSQPILLALTPGLFVLLWSTGFIGAKLGLPFAEPLTFLLIRFACVIGLLGLLALVLRRPWPHRPIQWFHIAVAGTLLHGGYLSGVFLAIHTGMPAGVVALIVGIQPLLTAFLSASMVGERVNGRQWAGLVLGFAGVTLVVWEKLGFAGLGAAGLAFSALALVSITLGTLYQKRFCAELDLWSGSPPTTALMAFLIFGEKLGLTAVAGMATAAAGVAIAVRQPSPPAPLPQAGEGRKPSGS